MKSVADQFQDDMGELVAGERNFDQSEKWDDEDTEEISDEEFSADAPTNVDDEDDDNFDDDDSDDEDEI